MNLSLTLVEGLAITSTSLSIHGLSFLFSNSGRKSDTWVQFIA